MTTRHTPPAAGKRESTLTLIIAVAANVAIAVVKLIAAVITGSSSMISESVHSLVDSGDGVLLLVGRRLARRAASRRHPFGHGQEVYFWSFVVATVIFGAGGGISMYEGITHIVHPEPLTDATVNYLVLGAAFLFEGISFVFAVKSFQSYRKTVPGAESALDAVQLGKDPPAFAVLLEDGAALVGILIAFAGVSLSHALDAPWIDGVASIGIGLVLAAVAIILGVESRGLLIGESATGELVGKVRALAGRDPAVAAVRAVRTMQLGPEDVLVALELTFRDGLDGDEVLRAAERLQRTVREEDPTVRYVYLGRGAPAD